MTGLAGLGEEHCPQRALQAPKGTCVIILRVIGGILSSGRKRSPLSRLTGVTGLQVTKAVQGDLMMSSM